ncbi:MAG: hypothetical protein JWP63_2957, partial [Candidatus Solibacter sp.]|nr:hypothetical protein [Candidatus Solibacter sp.]
MAWALGKPGALAILGALYQLD